MAGEEPPVTQLSDALRALEARRSGLDREIADVQTEIEAVRARRRAAEERRRERQSALIRDVLPKLLAEIAEALPSFGIDVQTEIEAEETGAEPLPVAAISVAAVDDQDYGDLAVTDRIGVFFRFHDDGTATIIRRFAPRTPESPIATTSADDRTDRTAIEDLDDVALRRLLTTFFEDLYTRAFLLPLESRLSERRKVLERESNAEAPAGD